MYRVILVDDEYYVRKSIQNRVSWAGLGCEICAEAENGLRALELIDEMKPDIVLVDIRMPEMDGLELIRRARESSPYTQFAILSGYDDFLYTREAIKLKVTDYIKKPVDVAELEKAVREMIRQIEANSEARQRYTELIGQAQHLAEMKIGRALNDLCGGVEDFSALEGLLDEGAYAWILIYCTQPENAAWEPERVKAEIARALQRTAGQRWHMAGNETDGGEIRVLLPTASLDAVQKAAGALYQGLSRAAVPESGVHFALACGRPVPLSGLYEQYALALEALKGKIFTGGRGIQHPGQFKPPMQEEVQAVFSLLESIKRCIAARHAGKLEYLLNQLFTEKLITSPRVLEDALFSLYGLTREYAVRYSVTLPEESVERMAGSRALLHYNSLASIREEALSLLSLLFCDGCPMDDEHITTQVKKFIDENYHDHIGLKSIAASFYLNASYLSSLFKRKTGGNLNRYIETVRIERAKVLLSSLDISVNELSMMIGYTDPNYFTRAFRKRTGKTPLEYRASRRGRTEPV